LAFPATVGGQNPDGVFNNLFTNNLSVGSGGITPAGNLTLSGNLLFSPDLTWNIGASGANRPNVVNTGALQLPISAFSDTVLLTNGYADIHGFLLLGQNTYLYAEAANVFAQRNAANPQIFRTYNTFTDVNNYERGQLEWSGNILRVQTSASGTGTARGIAINAQGDQLYLQTAGVGKWRITNAGHLYAETDNSFDIGANGANRPHNVWIAGSVFTPGVLGPAGLPLNLGGAGSNQWQIVAGGHIQPLADNSYDIGVAGTNRVRSIYAGSSLVSGSQIINQGNFVTGVGVQLNFGGSYLYSASGVPSNAQGVNGDYYFRTDTPGTANQRIYVRSAGAWVGIV